MPVHSEENSIFVHGALSQDDCFRLLAAMHNTVKKRGYSDFDLNFSSCTGAFSSEMVAICSKCQAYWRDNVDIKLTMPHDRSLSRLFSNANWAHLIDIRGYEPSRFRGYTHAPALKFSTGKDQHQAVEKTLDVLLAAISHFHRDEIRYIEWALNEITDNVVNHANSTVGGVVQITNFRQRKQIEMVVCDSGIGIPTTLKGASPNIRTDSEALYEAVQEGVTRDRSVGQGNGLYGTWRITTRSGGRFQIHSGYASLTSTDPKSLQVTKNQVPIDGTLIVARIGYGDKFDLSDALTFSGRRHIPTDYIETHFDEDENGNIWFVLRDESDGFGSRAAGAPVRRKLVNVINCLSNGTAVVDFDNVPLVSSSYADEVFGKLFIELGPLKFMSAVKFQNLDPLVGDLVDRAITQRMGQ